TNVPDDRYEIILEVRQTPGSDAETSSTTVLITSSVIAKLGEPSQSNVKLADLDGDGRSEVIVTTLESSNPLGDQGDGRIHVLSSSGSELPGWPVALNGR